MALGRRCIYDIRIERIRQCLFWLFALSILLFPLGQAFRVAMPLICLPVLVLLYVKDWPNSALAMLPVRGLFVVFFASVAMQIIFAVDVKYSFAVVRPNFFRAFILPFIGMECIRSEKDLRRLVVVFALTVAYEGLDGVWQYAVGCDFVRHAKLVGGRLTGSFGGYRVGDYMGIMLLPSFALILLMTFKNLWLRAAATLIVLAPALFLWVFAQARMGYLAVAVGGYALWVLAFNNTGWKSLLLPPVALALLPFIGIDRLSSVTLLNDGRIPIWKGAWEAFLHHPWLGTGIGSYEEALQAAGIVLVEKGVMHPHNAYLQFMVDGGILGFACMTLFLFGCAGWALLRIRQNIRWERTHGSGSIYWRLTGFFWAAWIGYLIVAAGGHDFYRGWFLATGMAVLGILLGAVVRGPGSGCVFRNTLCQTSFFAPVMDKKILFPSQKNLLFSSYANRI